MTLGLLSPCASLSFFYRQRHLKKHRNYASGIRVLDCTLQKNPAPQQNLGGCHLQLHFVLHEIINRSIMLLIDFC